jgi:hypothetical protein
MPGAFAASCSAALADHGAIATSYKDRDIYEKMSDVLIKTKLRPSGLVKAITDISPK